MSAPLNDVALAAFGTAAHLRLGSASGTAKQSRPRSRPAYSWVWRWASNTRPWSCVASWPPQSHCERSTGERQTLAASRPRWLALAAIYLATAAAVGGCWYLRAYVHTGNPVYPFFRHVFGGAGLDEVLDPDQTAARGHSASTCSPRLCRCRSSPTDSTVFRTSSARCFCSSCPRFFSIARPGACW